MPMKTADGLLLAVSTTSHQIGHDVHRRAICTWPTLNGLWKSLITPRSGLLISGQQSQRHSLLFKLNVVGVVFWMRNRCAKVIGQPLQITHPKGRLVLTGERDDLKLIKQADHEFRLGGR